MIVKFHNPIILACDNFFGIFASLYADPCCGFCLQILIDSLSTGLLLEYSRFGLCLFVGTSALVDERI